MQLVGSFNYVMVIFTDEPYGTENFSVKDSNLFQCVTRFYSSYRIDIIQETGFGGPRVIIYDGTPPISDDISPVIVIGNRPKHPQKN